MPYRVDIASPPHDAVDVLIALGALDLEALGEGVAAILPDSVMPDKVAAAFGRARVSVSAAAARDSGSVWLVKPRPLRIGNIVIAPAESAAPPGALRLTDSHAFGTGHHPTTVLCIETLEQILAIECPDSLLDVGTGSGILALAGLLMGAPRAVALDIDADALEAAAANAHLNHLAERLRLVRGGPDSVQGTWPLVVANVLAAPLIEMAPVLVRRIGTRGRLILSEFSRRSNPRYGRHISISGCGISDRRGAPAGRPYCCRLPGEEDGSDRMIHTPPHRVRCLRTQRVQGYCLCGCGTSV